MEEAQAEATNIPGLTPLGYSEEEDVELYSQRSKLYHFKDNEWKGRDQGDAKILQHRESGRVSFLMRQEKTTKIVAHHFVIGIKSYCRLERNAGNMTCWVWKALDDADGELAAKRFALQCSTPELASAFEDGAQPS